MTLRPKLRQKSWRIRRALWRKTVAVLALTFALIWPAYAQEKIPPAESDASKQWKELQAQEQWVARLQKQITGEAKQLSEMRASLAQKFKLDLKKLEAGLYLYDDKKDAFVENKSVIASGAAAKQSKP